MSVEPPHRIAQRLAWAMWLATLALLLASVPFDVLSSRGPNPAPVGLAELASAVGLGLLALALPVYGATLGVLIALRRPGNPIGWIVSAAALAFGLSALAESYAVYALHAAAGRLPSGAAAAALASILQGPLFIAVLPFLFLLFPNGRLLTPRWRWVAWLTAGASMLDALLVALQPGPLGFLSTRIENPWGVPALAGAINLLVPALFFIQLAYILVSVMAVILRFRRSHGVERQQLKWFMYAVAFLGVVVAANPFIWSNPALKETSLWPVLLGLAVAGILLAILIAIVRHDLYDIDLIINRTLVYGALTAVLALVYFGSVVSLQSLLRTLADQASQLAVVLSTLAIAVLFTPLRRRLQDLIDRRFYRRKYDAERILSGFSLSARDEVDLDQLGQHLLGVVEKTMQPRMVWLWLRPR